MTSGVEKLRASKKRGISSRAWSEFGLWAEVSLCQGAQLGDIPTT